MKHIWICASLVVLSLSAIGVAQVPTSPTAPAAADAALSGPPASTELSAQPVNATGAAAVPNVNLHCDKGYEAMVVLFCDNLTSLQNAVNNGKSEVDLIDTFNKLNPGGRTNADRVAVAISARLAVLGITASAAQLADQVRTDKQTGANSATSSGTTSLVTKAGSAELISLAVDTGALTQTVNGTTSTLATNADSLFRLITGVTPDCVMNCSKKEGGHEGRFQTLVLNPMNFTASLQLAQSSTTTTATSGQASGTTTSSVSTVAIPTGAGKLTAIGAKYEFLNSYDPRKPAFQTAWKKQVNSTLGSAVGTIAADVNAVFAILSKDAKFKAAEQDGEFPDTLFNAAKDDKSGAKLIAAFQMAFSSDINTAIKDPALPDAVATVIKDRADFRQAWSAALAQAAGSALAIQYNYNQLLNQPKTHDITIIGSYDWGLAGSLTFNGAVSIYQGALPIGAQYGRVHYGQVSGQYDRNLSGATNAYQVAMSLAGYWQYQPDPSILNIPAGTVAPGTTIPLPTGTQEFVGTAGSLWVTQGALTVKGPGGINVPLGVSWSNKTDLLQGSKVGAQLGISYNFSSLAGLF